VSPHTAHNWDGEDGAVATAVAFLCGIIQAASGLGGEHSTGTVTDSVLMQCRNFGDRELL